MENKQFGKSIMDFVPEEDKETIKSEFFEDSEYNMDEIEDMRKEISKNTNKKVTATVSKDALSGITSSKVENEELDDAINSIDIKGNTITRYGKTLIQSVMGREATDEECSQIAYQLDEYAEVLEDAIENETIGSKLSIEILTNIIPETIVNQIRGIAGDDFDSVFRRFVYQIYFTYSNTISFRDDISELNKISRMMKEINVTEEDLKSEDSAYESMQDISKTISKFFELTKGLDDRNKRMRQDYSIDDIETKTIKEVKECLDDAIKFKNVREKVNSYTEKFRKDVKKVNDMNKSIDNWIHDIKNDTTILYTFPCNDFLSDEESREAIVTFFYNAYLANIALDRTEETIPSDKDLEEYLLEHGTLDKNTIEILKHKARVMLYMISRTFKLKKIKNQPLNIRRLSYTLDIISKLGIKDHLNEFVSASDYVYDTLCKY